MNPARIIVTQAPGAPDEPPGESCRLKIQCGTTETASEITADAVRELLKINGSIKWYMEIFAIKQPFQAPKAQDISESLAKYAGWLIKALRLDLVAPEPDASHHLLIHIKEDVAISPRASTIVSILRWEVLQNVKLWPEEARPASVSVVHLVGRTSPAAVAAAAPQTRSDPMAIFNILALTARPKGVTDIPHRLITKSIYDVVERVNSEAAAAAASGGGGDGSTVGPKTTFNIVRPGSLRALKNELDLTKNGGRRYDLVHLDVHGVVRDDSAWALFINEDQRGADYVPAKELAEILSRHGVHTVVLNACQSAVEGAGPGANLAKALIQNGIRMAVAMAYKVLEPSARLFVCAFYDQLLRSDRPRSPLLAVQAARQCLIDNRIRQTKYLTKVVVDDYLVPSVYICQEDAVSESCETKLADLEALQENPPEPPANNLADIDVNLVGREGDLLVLETFLLLDSCIVGIEGQPGIGKSALAESAALWWKSTALIDRYIRIDITAAVHPHSLSELLNQKLKLGLTADDELGDVRARAKKVKAKIKKGLRRAMKNSSRLLILFDGVESSGPHKVSEPDLELLHNFLSVFKAVQEDSTAGATYANFVIITARRMPKLNMMEGTEPRRVHVLASLDEERALHLATHILDKTQRLPDAKDWEGLLVTTQLGKLTQGNPLALKILLGAFRFSEYDLLGFLQSLLRGDSIALAGEVPPDTTAPGPGLPVDLVAHSAVSDVRRLLEPVDGRSTAVRGLYPFWTSFPRQTLKDYLSYCRFETTRRGPPAFEQRENRALADQCGGFGDDELKLLYGKYLRFPGSSETAAVDILRPFIDEGFAVVGKLKDGMGESEAEYVTLHPLVALVMRDGSMVSEQSQAQSWARDVMPKLFRYRIKSWPMNAFYWKKAWDGPRESLRWEFYNFLGAAYCAIYRAVDIKPSMLATLMLLGLAQATSKGLVWDRSRRPLMASFWRTAANGMRHERQRSREAARRVVPVNDWLLRLIGHMAGSGGEINVRLATDTTNEMLRLQHALFVDLAEMVFCMYLIDYYTRHDEDAVHGWHDRLTETYRHRTWVPWVDIAITRIFDEVLSLISSGRAAPSPSENFAGEQMAVKAAARKKLYSTLGAAGFDVDGYDAGTLRGEALREEGSSGSGNSGGGDDDDDDKEADDSGGRGMLELGNSLLGQDEDVFVAVLLAKRKMARRPPDVDVARNLLYKALDNDLALGASPANIAIIHRALSEEVEEKAARLAGKEAQMGTETEDKDGGRRRDHWRRALYHWEQALEVERGAGFEKLTDQAERENIRTNMLGAGAAGCELPPPDPGHPTRSDERRTITTKAKAKAAEKAKTATTTAEMQTRAEAKAGQGRVAWANTIAGIWSRHTKSAVGFWKMPADHVGSLEHDGSLEMETLEQTAPALLAKREAKWKAKGAGAEPESTRLIGEEAEGWS